MAKRPLIVVDDPERWRLGLEGAETVSAWAYLTGQRYVEMRGVQVFNCCRNYRYQSVGYYVSLLAAARGHKPLPSVGTMQDLRLHAIIRLVSEEQDELIQKSLKPLRSSDFLLSIYFGRNLAKRYDRLAWQLFRQFQAPFLRARFLWNEKDERWNLQRITSIGESSIPPEHRDFAAAMAREYFLGRRRRPERTATSRYDLAILTDPAAVHAPSNPQAVRRFAKAAEQVGFEVEMIERDDIGLLAQFDALFIREDTNVNHHTFRFARRAAAEGLVVIDDPESILRCTNKVYLAELLAHHGVPTPRSRVVHRGNMEGVVGELGLPCILKQPDSSFSQGVVKVDDMGQYRETVAALLQKSELVIAQEFMPTEFDWRIGIFNRKPLFACRYYMARKHWQILKHDVGGRVIEGKFDALALEAVPRPVLRTAQRAANLIGDGLYGVDLKQAGRGVYVIEVNDNPNIDAGVEDTILKGRLYLTIMEEMMRRVEQRKEARP